MFEVKGGENSIEKVVAQNKELAKIVSHLNDVRSLDNYQTINKMAKQFDKEQNSMKSQLEKQGTHTK